MDKDRIVENGIYEDLMQMAGSFAHLFEAHE